MSMPDCANPTAYIASPAGEGSAVNTWPMSVFSMFFVDQLHAAWIRTVAPRSDFCLRQHEGGPAMFAGPRNALAFIMAFLRAKIMLGSQLSMALHIRVLAALLARYSEACPISQHLALLCAIGSPRPRRVTAI